MIGRVVSLEPLGPQHAAGLLAVARVGRVIGHVQPTDMLPLGDALRLRLAL